MIEQKERVIGSLHEILSDLLAKNVNIYGAAIAQPNGHIIASEFQLGGHELPIELENYKENQEKTVLDTKKPEVNNNSSDVNQDEEMTEYEKMSADEAGIFILAYSYSLLEEVVKNIGRILHRGKLKSIYLKSSYTNLIVIPVTTLTNFLLIVPSGTGFDYRFFTESKTLNRDLDDLAEYKIENVGNGNDEIEYDPTIMKKKEEELEKYFNDFREELPGLLGIGHVGIKSSLGSQMFFGTFKERFEEYLKNEEIEKPENDIGRLLSYLFFVGDKIIQEERNLELDLIQLEYEQGNVLLKSIGDIAFIFDTEEPFQHLYIEQNLPNPPEFQQILHKIEDASNDLINLYENVDTWLKKGVRLLKKGKSDQAVEYFTKSIDISSKSPYNADFWYTLGRKLGERARYKEAIACFEQVHEEDPSHKKSWIKQAKANYLMDREKKALRCMKRAIRADRTDQETWLLTGTLCSEIKRDRKAVYYLKNALKLNPLSEETWQSLGHAYFEIKKYRKAIQSYEKVLEIDKNSSSAWIGIGWTLHKMKKYHKSIEAFDISISMDPDSAVAWNDRGCCFYRLKDYEEAMKNYEKSMELDPLLKYPWSNIGEVNEKYGNYQIAVDYFEQARKLDSKDRDYKRFLRRAKRKLQRAQKKFFGKLTKISNVNPKLSLSDLNDTLKAEIKPLLKENSNLKDLLIYFIKSKKMKAKISQNCLEFV